MKKGALARWGSKLVVVLADDDQRTAFVKIVKGDGKDTTGRAPWSELEEVQRRKGGRRKKAVEQPSPACDPRGCPYCGAQYPTYMQGIECANCGYHEGAGDDFKVPITAGDAPALPAKRRRVSRRRVQTDVS